MLMGTDNRRLEKELAGQRTGVCLEPLPELAPEPAPFPAAKAVRDRVPVSKRLWEVTPGRPRAGKVQQGFNEHPIAEYRRASSARFDGGKDGGHLRPGLIRQQQTYRHEVSSRMYTMNGREKTYPGIMNSSTRPSNQEEKGDYAYTGYWWCGFYWLAYGRSSSGSRPHRACVGRPSATGSWEHSATSLLS